MIKVKLKPFSMRNQCPSCEELFNSVHSFEKHRIGAYGVEDKKNPGTYLPANRRCMTLEKMTDSGMVKNSDGWWVSEAREIMENWSD